MTKTLTRIVDASFEGMRLDQFLASEQLYASRSAAQKALEDASVFVNGVVEVSKNYRIHTDDEVCVQTNEVMCTDIGPEPQCIPLDIRYEDDYLIVLSKQRGLICHPSANHEDHTLVNALIYHCGSDHLGTLQGPDRLGLVHRLDMDTSGLMLAAKDDQTQDELQQAIRARSVSRHYLCLVHGIIAPDNGLIDAPICRAPKVRNKMSVGESSSSRPALTTFVVLERFAAAAHDSGFSLLECKLHTGRTHQIRVHMAYIGHPVAGDPLYGSKAHTQILDLDRQFLHSWNLEFSHPRTHERMSFHSDLPWDLDEVLSSLDTRTSEMTSRGSEVRSYLEAMHVHPEISW